MVRTRRPKSAATRSPSAFRVRAAGGKQRTDPTVWSPMTSTLFSQPYASFLALGVGGLGGRAAVAASLDGFGETAPWAACDSQAPRLLSTGLERKLLIELPDPPRADVATDLVAKKRNELRALAEGRTRAILFGALGEPATRALLQALASALREEDVFTCIVGLEALELEGSAPANAPGLDDRLARSADLFLRLPSAPLLAPLGEGVLLSQAYREAERALTAAVEALLGAFVGTSAAPAFTPTRLLNALRGVGAASASVGTGSGKNAPCEALEAALGKPWQEAEPWLRAGAPETATGGLAAALAAGREIALAEAQAITKRLQELAPPGVPPLLGIGLDASLGDEARCLIIHSRGRSRNVVSLA
jgi:hypothetical protein